MKLSTAKSQPRQPPPRLASPPALPVLFYDQIRVAIINGVFVLLSPQEFALLRAVCGTMRGEIYSRDQLAAQLYAALPPDTRSIRVLMCRLRRKLAERGVPAEVVRTIRTQGYRADFAGLVAA